MPRGDQNRHPAETDNTVVFSKKEMDLQIKNEQAVHGAVEASLQRLGQEEMRELVSQNPSVQEARKHLAGMERQIMELQQSLHAQGISPQEKVTIENALDRLLGDTNGEKSLIADAQKVVVLAEEAARQVILAKKDETNLLRMQEHAAKQQKTIETVALQFGVSAVPETEQTIRVDNRVAVAIQAGQLEAHKQLWQQIGAENNFQGSNQLTGEILGDEIQEVKEPFVPRTREQIGKVAGAVRFDALKRIEQELGGVQISEGTAHDSETLRKPIYALQEAAKFLKMIDGEGLSEEDTNRVEAVKSEVTALLAEKQKPVEQIYQNEFNKVQEKVRAFVIPEDKKRDIVFLRELKKQVFPLAEEIKQMNLDWFDDEKKKKIQSAQTELLYVLENKQKAIEVAISRVGFMEVSHQYEEAMVDLRSYKNALEASLAGGDSKEKIEMFRKEYDDAERRVNVLNDELDLFDQKSTMQVAKLSETPSGENAVRTTVGLNKNLSAKRDKYAAVDLTQPFPEDKPVLTAKKKGILASVGTALAGLATALGVNSAAPERMQARTIDTKTTATAPERLADLQYVGDVSNPVQEKPVQEAVAPVEVQQQEEEKTPVVEPPTDLPVGSRTEFRPRVNTDHLMKKIEAAVPLDWEHNTPAVETADGLDWVDGGTVKQAKKAAKAPDASKLDWVLDAGEEKTADGLDWVNGGLTKKVKPKKIKLANLDWGQETSAPAKAAVPKVEQRAPQADARIGKSEAFKVFTRANEAYKVALATGKTADGQEVDDNQLQALKKQASESYAAYRTAGTEVKPTVVTMPQAEAAPIVPRAVNTERPASVEKKSAAPRTENKNLFVEYTQAKAAYDIAKDTGFAIDGSSVDETALAQLRKQVIDARAAYTAEKTGQPVVAAAVTEARKEAPPVQRVEQRTTTPRLAQEQTAVSSIEKQNAFRDYTLAKAAYEIARDTGYTSEGKEVTDADLVALKKKAVETRLRYTAEKTGETVTENMVDAAVKKETPVQVKAEVKKQAPKIEQKIVAPAATKEMNSSFREYTVAKVAYEIARDTGKTADGTIVDDATLAQLKKKAVESRATYVQAKNGAEPQSTVAVVPRVEVAEKAAAKITPKVEKVKPLIRLTTLAPETRAVAPAAGRERARMDKINNRLLAINAEIEAIDTALIKVRDEITAGALTMPTEVEAAKLDSTLAVKRKMEADKNRLAKEKSRLETQMTAMFEKDAVLAPASESVAVPEARGPREGLGVPGVRDTVAPEFRQGFSAVSRVEQGMKQLDSIHKKWKTAVIAFETAKARYGEDSAEAQETGKDAADLKAEYDRVASENGYRKGQ